MCGGIKMASVLVVLAGCCDLFYDSSDSNGVRYK